MISSTKIHQVIAVMTIFLGIQYKHLFHKAFKERFYFKPCWLKLYFKRRNYTPLYYRYISYRLNPCFKYYFSDMKNYHHKYILNKCLFLTRDLLTSRYYFQRKSYSYSQDFKICIPHMKELKRLRCYQEIIVIELMQT